MRTLQAFLFALPVLAPAELCAEVMHEEQPVSDIWMSLLWSLVIWAVAVGLWRWLLVPSFACGLLSDLGYAWTEWFSVGPAIRAQAGEAYGYHLNAAVTLLLLGHIAAWFLASWRSVVGVWWCAADRASLQGRLDALWYAALLVLLTGLVAGLAMSYRIWLSPAILVSVAFFSWTGLVYVRSRVDVRRGRPTTGSSGRR